MPPPSPITTLKKLSTTVLKKGVGPAFKAAWEYDRTHGGRMIKKTFQGIEWIWALAHIPPLGGKIPTLDPNLSDISHIPINKDIQGGEGIALPEQVLDRLIDLSGYRAILHSCMCRRIAQCKEYPEDLACIFMGEAAKLIPDHHKREVSKQEAKDHARKAIAAGLVPIVGEARGDYSLLRIPYEGNEGRLLTNCFCCECCCLSRAWRKAPVSTVDAVMHPVEGLTVEVTDDCVGCGACVTTCFIDAIQVRAGRAVIDDYCRVCGRCAAACPNDAIKLKLDNPHAVDDVVNRILARVDLS
jgi:ferredoxin